MVVRGSSRMQTRRRLKDRRTQAQTDTQSHTHTLTHMDSDAHSHTHTQTYNRHFTQKTFTPAAAQMTFRPNQTPAARQPQPQPQPQLQPQPDGARACKQSKGWNAQPAQATPRRVNSSSIPVQTWVACVDVCGWGCDGDAQATRGAARACEHTEHLLLIAIAPPQQQEMKPPNLLLPPQAGTVRRPQASLVLGLSALPLTFCCLFV